MTDACDPEVTAPEQSESILHNSLGGGPCGLGDPDNRYLRKVEKEILIPKIVQQKSKEKCADEVKVFSDCSKKNGLLLPFKCRKENTAMKECLFKWYSDKKFVDEVTEEYLKDRSEYRRTGISQKQKRKESATF